MRWTLLRANIKGTDKGRGKFYDWPIDPMKCISNAKSKSRQEFVNELQCNIPLNNWKLSDQTHKIIWKYVSPLIYTSTIPYFINQLKCLFIYSCKHLSIKYFTHVNTNSKNSLKKYFYSNKIFLFNNVGEFDYSIESKLLQITGELISKCNNEIPK